MPENEPAAALPLLFLVADTGGGHRNAARAVGQALDRMYPGRFAPVLCDPLGGPVLLPAQQMTVADAGQGLSRLWPRG